MAEKDDGVIVSKRKRKGLIITASIMLGIIVTFFAVWLILYIVIDTADKHTDQEHIARITERAKKRYITGDGQYTDLQVYPVYNQDDKMEYALIELEPTGYVYVRINDKAISYSLYTRSTAKDPNRNSWARRTVELGTMAEIEMNGKTYTSDHTRWTELDDNGKPIIYNCSHFKAANIQDERRYILDVRQGGSHYYIVAVKRDDKYLNLVSMEYFDYQYSIDTLAWATAWIGFNPDKYFDL